MNKITARTMAVMTYERGGIAISVVSETPKRYSRIVHGTVCSESLATLRRIRLRDLKCQPTRLRHAFDVYRFLSCRVFALCDRSKMSLFI